MRDANRIVRGWDGYFGFGIKTRSGPAYGSTIFDVKRQTVLRFIRQARRRHQTVLLSDVFGTLVIG